MNEPVTWEQALIQRYKRLFITSLRGAPFTPGYPTCPPGWRDIVTRLVERLFEAAASYPVRFTQISEKCAQLQIYWTSDTDLPKKVEEKIEEAVALAVAASASSCGICGAEGQLFSDEGRLIRACGKHMRGVVVPTRPSLANIHFVRRCVGQRCHVIRCCRYDRTLDAFVDVNPSSLAIKN